MAFATSSLPVPVSPPISTLRSEPATISISFFNCVIAGDRPIMCVSFIGSNTPDDPGSMFWLSSCSINSALLNAPAASAATSRNSSSLNTSNCSGVIASRVSAPMRFCPANSGRPTQAWTFRLSCPGINPSYGSGKSLSAGKRTTSPARAMASRRGCPSRVKRLPRTSCARPSIASGINCRDS